MPLAPAFFSAGRMCRTTFSSMMTSIAIHPASARSATVGVCIAGRIFITFGSTARGRFILSPTLSSAASAACSSRLIVSIFSRFQAFFHAAGFAISLVRDTRTSSTIRRLFARSELPVSVSSTMASASTGGLASVDPQGTRGRP